MKKPDLNQSGFMQKGIDRSAADAFSFFLIAG
jgi:hypothetical protein